MSNGFEVVDGAAGRLKAMMARKRNNRINVKAKIPFVYKYELAIVAIIKDEADNIQEWLDYHIVAGANVFLIYDNGSTDGTIDLLQPYIDSGVVILHHIWDNNNVNIQIVAYNDAIIRYRFICRYMAFIDIDEFIMGRSHKSISEITEEIMELNSISGGVSANWAVFGSSGLKYHPKNGILSEFVYRTNKAFTNNRDLKQIVNPRLVRLKEVHYAEFFADRFSVDENGNTVVFSNESKPSSKIRVNHYIIKSKEDYDSKINRGDAYYKNNHQRTWAEFEMNDKYDVLDYDILYYLKMRLEVLEGLNTSGSFLQEHFTDIMDYFLMKSECWIEDNNYDVSIEDFFAFYYNGITYYNDEDTIEYLHLLVISFIMAKIQDINSLKSWEIDLLISVMNELSYQSDFTEISECFYDCVKNMANILKSKAKLSDNHELSNIAICLSGYLNDRIDGKIRDAVALYRLGLVEVC